MASRFHPRRSRCAAGLNLYSYCGNNPVGYVDPNGEFLIPTAIGGAVIGGLIGGVGGYLSSGGDWQAVAAGAGRGALIGGIMGATGGAAAWAATGVVGTSLGGAAVSGAFGGAVGSAWGQGAQVALGWRSGYSSSELGVSAAFGGVAGGAVRGIQIWRAAKQARAGCDTGSASTGAIEEYPYRSYTEVSRDPNTGQVLHYETRVPNEYVPGRFRAVKRFDGVGDAHYDKQGNIYIPTPHVHLPSKAGGPLNRVRSPRSDELPPGY